MNQDVGLYINCACAGEIAVCNATFRSTSFCFFPEIFALKLRSCPKLSHKFWCFGPTDNRYSVHHYDWALKTRISWRFSASMTISAMPLSSAVTYASDGRIPSFRTSIRYRRISWAKITESKNSVNVVWQCESKKIPRRFFWPFFRNGWEFLVHILNAYCIHSYLR